MRFFFETDPAPFYFYDTPQYRICSLFFGVTSACRSIELVNINRGMTRTREVTPVIGQEIDYREELRQVMEADDRDKLDFFEVSASLKLDTRVVDARSAYNIAEKGASLAEQAALSATRCRTSQLDEAVISYRIANDPKLPEVLATHAKIRRKVSSVRFPSDVDRR